MRGTVMVVEERTRGPDAGVGGGEEETGGRPGGVSRLGATSVVAEAEERRAGRATARPAASWWATWRTMARDGAQPVTGRIGAGWRGRRPTEREGRSWRQSCQEVRGGADEAPEARGGGGGEEEASASAVAESRREGGESESRVDGAEAAGWPRASS
jgi:hypothetical protein